MKENELKYSDKDAKKIMIETSLITSLSFILVFLMVIFIVLFFDLFPQKQSDLPMEIRKYNEIISLYQNNYIDDVDLSKSVDYSINAFIASTGDKYGGYIPVKESAITGAEILTGNYYGVGISFILNDTYLEVVDIVKDSPAGVSNLQVGDKVIKINGVSVNSEVYEDFRLKISVRDIDSVVFTLEDMSEVTIFLGEVKTPKVDWSIEGDTAYIFIYTFVEDSIELFKEAFEEIVDDDNVNNLVFDLRGNRGGDVNAVTAMLDYILDPCILITIDNANENVEDTTIYSDSFNMLKKDYNVNVLVNRETASASELFTAVLRHYMGAIVVGEKTYGKGTVVTCYTFKDGSILMLTSGVYTMPDGSNIEGIGIVPDIELNEYQLTRKANELKYLGLLEKSNPVS